MQLLELELTRMWHRECLRGVCVISHEAINCNCFKIFFFDFRPG